MGKSQRATVGGGGTVSVPSRRPHPYFGPMASATTNTAANRVILMCGIGEVVVVLLARIDPNNKKIGQNGSVFRVMAGATVVTILLMVFAEANAKLAEQFSLLVFLGSVIVYGTSAFGTLNKVYSATPATTANAPVKTAPTATIPSPQGTVIV